MKRFLMFLMSVLWLGLSTQAQVPVSGYKFVMIPTNKTLNDLLVGGVAGIVPSNTTNYAGVVDSLVTNNGIVSFGIGTNIISSTEWYTPESEFTFDGVGAITAYSGTNSEVRVPPTIGGVAVTNIGVSAFSPSNAGTPTLVTLVCPASVTTIGAYAFYNCTALTSASMPSATTIGDSAFDSCAALTSASMPGVTTIGNNAFYDCNALTSVSIPSATTIGESAFGSCTALTSVSIPSATTIGNYAFYYCSALTSAYFSVNAPTLGTAVFYSTAPCIAYYLQGRTGYDSWDYTNTWVDSGNIYSLAVNGKTADANGNINTIFVTTNTSVSSSFYPDGAIPVCNLELIGDTTIYSPTNYPHDGSKVQIRMYADGADRTITLDTVLKIPSSSTMSNVFVITNGTTSILLLDRYDKTSNWLVEAYIWGY